MKKFFVFVFVVFAFTFVIYAVPSFRQKTVKALSYSRCDSALPYKLGTIDQRFGLSQTNALDDIKTAGEIWSKTEGKDLFTYSQKADLTVSFVYDQRQELDTKIDQLNDTLRQKNSTLQQQINDYKAQVASFEQRLAAFNAKVEKYNQEGGAPPDVYHQLIKEQNELKAEGDTLNARAKELNLSTGNYNAGVSELNQDVNQFNNALSQKPEEGTYDGEKDTITIYFVDDHQELIHTLAHEFGHALGMNHVGNPVGIMYAYTSPSVTISPEDLAQLNLACREKSIFIHFAEEFDKWFVDLY